MYHKFTWKRLQIKAKIINTCISIYDCLKSLKMDLLTDISESGKFQNELLYTYKRSYITNIASLQQKN